LDFRLKTNFLALWERIANSEWLTDKKELTSEVVYREEWLLR